MVRFGQSIRRGMMRKALFILILVFTGLALTVACGWILHTRTPPKSERQTAPGFSLPDQQGRVVTLDDVTATGPAVVVFYRGYW